MINEAQVEAAAKVLAPDGVFAEDFGEYSRKRDNYRREDQAEEQRYYMRKARAALVAAAATAPQAESGEPWLDAAGNEAQKCLRCGKYVFECCESFAPVLPSSTVDEDALMKAWHEGFCRGEASGAREVPMNPDEWNPYRGKGGERRGE